jgi:hypothetical protein
MIDLYGLDDVVGLLLTIVLIWKDSRGSRLFFQTKKELLQYESGILPL